MSEENQAKENYLTPGDQPEDKNSANKTGNPQPNINIKGGNEAYVDRLNRLADGRVEIEFARPLEAQEILPEMLAILGHRYGNQMKFDVAKRLIEVRTYPEDWIDTLRVLGRSEEVIAEFKLALTKAAPKEI